MRYRLRPVRPRHQARLRLTLATLLLPLLGIVLLTRTDVARRPLAEREATLAIDLQRMRRAELGQESSPELHGNWTSTSMALVARMPRLAGDRELQLRLAGLVAGALALGVLVRLGTRLFAPRVGIAVAVLMLALPTGRHLIGIDLGVEPFYLVSALLALLAIRGMAQARIAAVFAGAASGVAFALAGLDALWLPLLALAWLRVHQGLGWRSAGVVIGTTALATAVAIAAGWLLHGRGAGEPMLPLAASLAYLDATLLRPAPAARELIPLLPLIALGLWSMRGTWWQSESFRFLLLWLVFAAGSWALFGSAAGAYVALLFLACAVALLALEHARLLLSLPACGIAIGLAVAFWQAAPKPSESQMIDSWAIREAGRFVGRVIGADRRVAANPRAARRFAYYANRTVEPFTNAPLPPENADYVILPRPDYQLLREQRSPREEGVGRDTTKHLERIAEFGSWVVARLSPARE